MTSGDTTAMTGLERDYGRDWQLGRTFTDPAKTIPNWWRATRRRRLDGDELSRGLSQTLMYDTPELLREALAAQAELEERSDALKRAAR